MSAFDVSNAFEVPTVDISAYVGGGSPADRRACAAAMDAACSAVGFVQIVGHGIPADAINGLKAAMDDFFAQDLDVKKEYRTPPHINRGYAPPKSESLSLSLGVEAANRMNDFFEAFNVGSHRGLLSVSAAETRGANLGQAALRAWCSTAPRSCHQRRHEARSHVRQWR